MAISGEAPIIIKKIKKGGGGGHHGGAWKVAYADFVTAMMAFFLLMWLINTTSPEQRRGIAEFFAPASVSRVSSGAGGLLSGTSFAEDGVRNGHSAPVAATSDANDCANDDSSSCATTWLTSPMRSASSAATKLPVIDISRALRMPIARGNNAVSPHVATTPGRAWVSAKRARSR